MIRGLPWTRSSGVTSETRTDAQWVWPGRIHGYTSATMGVDDQGFWVEFGHHEGTTTLTNPWTTDFSSDFGA